MSERSYALGDLVELRSGGPVMTVSSIPSQGTVYCKWFVGGKLQVGDFAIGVLEPAREKKSRGRGSED
jgi:uncharacterized protein YodC (DUF2158 family)